MHYYNKNIMGLLFNDIMNYAFIGGTDISDFNVYEQEIRSLDVYLAEEKIVIEKREKDEFLIEQIEAAINEKMPVIIMVDCMYESLNKECYQIEHSPHSILIYGYDAQERLFYIVEHRSDTSTYYEKLVISYEEMLQCYEGFMNHFVHLDIQNSSLYDWKYNDELIAPGTFIIHGQADAIVPESQFYIAQYFEEYARKEEQIREGLENLRVFRDNFLEVLKDEAELKDKVQTLLKMLINVISRKNIERYRYNRLEGKESLKFYINTIALHWEKIRDTLVRFEYSKVFTKKIAERIEKHLDEIILYEEKLFFWQFWGIRILNLTEGGKQTYDEGITSKETK